MKKYYEETQKLIELANALFEGAKKKPVNLGVVKFKARNKFKCSWKPFDQHLELLLSVDPRYSYDKETYVLSFDKDVKVSDDLKEFGL